MINIYLWIKTYKLRYDKEYSKSNFAEKSLLQLSRKKLLIPIQENLSPHIEKGL